ncbi:MAG: 2-amino-4-hydroxy-6-hydroxymethyldihydropteridine diphosphokinase [Hyphomicrobiaceae bacterium]|nr:2-amino-4-hydroxy-6-hydroxymethyldihydropteridine diphosphokinase [Hyphomicrobiaceae bacterium]
MPRVWLGFGGNLGHVGATIDAAIDKLAGGGLRLLARSADYETPPWGKTDQPNFVNAVARFDTALDPHAVLALALRTEAELGRQRREKWGPRVIDIDILVYEGIDLDEPNLSLPHPYIRDRAFVLVPLAEIDPDMIIAGEPLAHLIQHLDITALNRLPPRR